MMGAVWFLLGVALGGLNVLAQWWTVARLRPNLPRQAMLLVMGGAVLRLFLVAGPLLAAFRGGFVLGLLGLTGFWLARWGVVCWLNQVDYNWGS